MINGIILIDKPKNITSYGVVDKIKKHFLLKKVGHGGTLDPFATGLLIVLIGRATKISSQFLNCNKSYEGLMTIGKETDTFDLTGKVVNEIDASKITAVKLNEVIKSFSGPIKQKPPLFSAIKVNGQKAYKLARKGKSIELAERDVKIYELSVDEFTGGKYPKAAFSCRVSKGTYIRSLAHDIGKSLGVGAYLEELRRTEVGHFSIQDALSLDEVLKWDPTELQRHLIEKKNVSV